MIHTPVRTSTGKIVTTARAAPITRGEWRWLAAAITAIIGLNSLPCALGYLIAPAGLHFTGLLLNGPDANSYLAKMQEGMRGEWLFTLPYTDNPGPGAFLLTHYLLLGHIAAALHLDLIVVYNAARIAGGAVLLWTLYAFVARCMTEVSQRRLAFWLASLGSGLGWLALIFGARSPDLWLAEAYPFLGTFANAHFPWSMAAVLWVFMALLDGGNGWPAWLGLAGGTLLLAIAQPFGLVTIAVCVLLWLAGGRWLDGHWNRPALLRLAVIGVIALPFLIYDEWVTATQSALRAWSEQNVTLSPPPWDYALGGGLVLVLALLAAARRLWRAWQQRTVQPPQDLLVCWLLTSAVLAYVPFSLQRRFTFGLFIPLAILAAEVLYPFCRGRPARRLAFVLGISLTNILLIAVSLVMVSAHAPELYFSADEWAALMYLRVSAPPQAVVLASPEMGNLIPAWSGQRVFYGHDSETPQAALRRTEVEQFFSGTLTDTDPMLQRTDYVFLGPHERLLGTPLLPPSFAPVWAQGEITIFQKMNRLP